MNVQDLNKSSEWGPYVDKVLGLYRGGLTLREISTSMQNRYGLKKSDRQYKGLFNKHKVKKNRTATAWATVSRRVSIRDRQGKRSEVFIDGVRIPETKWKRENKRYQRSNHACWKTSSKEHIVVRTPSPGRDPADDDDSEPIKWKDYSVLVNKHPLEPESLVVSTSNPCETHQDALVLPRNTHDSWDNISLPEEAMDDEDLGNLRILARKIHLRGIRLLEHSDGNSFPVERDRSSTSATSYDTWLFNILPGQKRLIERSLACNWTWESLSVIFEGFVTCPDTRRLRSKLYGNPTDMAAFFRFTKTDMLNCLVDIVLRNRFPTPRYPKEREWAEKLQEWLWHPQNLWVSELLLKSHNRPLTIAFAYNFFFHYHTIKDQDEKRQEGLIGLQALKLCFEFLSSPRQCLPATMIRALIGWSIEMGMPESVTALALNASAGQDSAILASRQRGMAELPLETVALLLSRGASADMVLALATKAISDASWTGDKTSKEYQLLLMGLARGADVDAVPGETFPLSIAEYFALRTPRWGHLLRDWVGDSLSREVIDVYRSSCNSVVLSGCSPVGQEIALYGLVRHCVPDLRYESPTTTGRLVQIRYLLECGTSPNLPILFQKKHPELAQEWHGFGKALSHEAYSGKRLRATDRGRFDFCHLMDLPLDVCRYRRNAEATQLLLEFGAPVSRHLLEDFEHCMSYQYTKHFSESERQANFEFVRRMSDYLAQKRTRADIHLVSGCLLLWGIRCEDEALIRRLAAKGVDLWDDRCLGRCTPFLKALKVSSLRFAKVIWDIQSDLLPSTYRPLGAYELVEVCRSGISEWWNTSEAIIERISFLLGLGAAVNGTSAWDGGIPLTPLQATLEASCYRGWPRSWDPQKLAAICAYLVDRGAHVDASESMAATPLQLAALTGAETTMRFLLWNGADPNITRYVSSGQSIRGILSSPLMMVSCLKECSCLDPDEGRHPNVDRISVPSSPCKRYELTRMLFQAGADINLPLEGSSTPLVETCRRGCPPTMELLLQYGANVNERAGDGCHPIEAVISSLDRGPRRIEMVYKLLEGGAHLDERGMIDHTLWESLQLRDIQRFETRWVYLSRSEALCDDRGDLYGRCQWNAIIGVEAILQAGADVNYVQNLNGRVLRPLSAAIQREDLHGVICLLDNGAEVVDDGPSFLNSAICLDSYEITKVLYNAGARPLWDSEEFEDAQRMAETRSGNLLPLIESWKQA